MPETRKYTVVDLFAGVGGLSYGFSRNDRFEIILANEMQKDIAKAYTLNHPSVNMLQGDIKDLSEDILRQAIGNRTVDVVVGGPPCQSYSTLGKRQMDARANLFMEYKRVLCILHPRAFLFENVKGILSMDKGALFEHVRKEFEDIGYSLQYKILNAVDYGVPQLRERVILVGFLGENSLLGLDFVDHIQRLIYEYNGKYPHADAAEKDRFKFEAVRKAGYKGIRVLEPGLEVLDPKYDIVMPEGFRDSGGRYNAEIMEEVGRKVIHLLEEIYGRKASPEIWALNNFKEFEIWYDANKKELEANARKKGPKGKTAAKMAA